MTSRTLRLALWAVPVAAALVGCGGRPTPPPAPDGIRSNPLENGGVEGRPLPGALPTWTVGPPGAGIAVAPAPGVVQDGGPPGPSDAAAALPGAMPVPTARPPQVLGAGGPPAADPEIVALMGQVDPGRLMGDVRTLAGFGTRHSLSSTELRNRGIGAARTWLMSRFDSVADGSVAQIQTEEESFDVTVSGTRTTQRNLIATLTGIGEVKRFVYVTAHYDSRSEDPRDGQAAAPGANDNASGTAALLELARVLGSRQWDASVRLMAFAAEEHNLAGSRHHAPLAAKAGLPIVAVLNNDIIGATRAADGRELADRSRVFSAGPDDGASRRLARYVHTMAARYGLPGVEVVPQADRPGRGGDHQPFSDAGFAAARIIEAADDQGRQHTAFDTPDRLDPAYFALMVRLNVALVANLALAPPAPQAAPSLEAAGASGVRVSWTPVPAPGVAGYYVAWRPVAAAAYQGVLWAGAGTEHDLAELPPGPVAVAVAAADDMGHMSLFSPEALR